MKLMAKFFKSVWKSSKNLAWALIVAFLLGVHNFLNRRNKVQRRYRFSYRAG